MICDDCAAAADFADNRFPTPVDLLQPATVEHLRRGHARCRTLQLVTGQGRLPNGDPVAIKGHHCDCQHRSKTAVVGAPLLNVDTVRTPHLDTVEVAANLEVVPASGAPPQSDEQAVVEVLEVRDA